MKKLLFLATAAAVVLSSCSKDTTEVVAPAQKNGNVVFSASLNVENDGTRLHIGKPYENEDNKVEYPYVWDAYDAIGVSGVSGKMNIAAISKGADSYAASFAVSDDDLRFFEQAEDNSYELFFYYPYDVNKENVVEDDVIKGLAIPAVQNYKKDSFFKNTAPAVGYVEKYAGADTEIKMTIPATIIRVPVKGVADLSSLTLKIKKNATEYHQLSGTGDVDMNVAENESPVLTLNTAGDCETIKINCGYETETMMYETTVDFYFIVPAGLSLPANALEFYANDDLNTPVATYGNPAIDALPTNSVINLTKGITIGLDNAILIKSAEQFVTWAYAAAHEVYSLEDKTALIEAGYLKETSGSTTLAEAIILEDIDLADYAPEFENPDFVAADRDLSYHVASWYALNGNAIITLDNVVINGEAATISNLKVKGDHAFTNNAALKNLTFDALTATKVWENVPSVTDVTIANPAVTAVFDNVKASDNLEEVTVTTEEATVYATTLIVDDNIDVTNYYADNFTFAKITGDVTTGGTILSATAVNDKDAILEVVDIAENKWFSVIIDGTSYWTGAVAENIVDDDNFTAEELRYAVDNNVAVVLDTPIDLQNKPWVASSSAKTVTVAEGKDATISNVMLTNKLDEETYDATFASVTGNLALFGASSTIDGVTVDGLTIDVQYGKSNNKVSGLATKGTAKNVIVKNATLALSVAEGFDASKVNVQIGIVLGSATQAAKTGIENVYVTGVNLLSTDITMFTKANIGIAVGKLTTSLDETTIKVGYKSVSGFSKDRIIGMWDGKNTQYANVKGDKDVYSGALIGTVAITGIPETIAGKLSRDLKLQWPENALVECNPGSINNARYCVAGYTFSKLNAAEKFTLNVNYYNNWFEQGIKYVAPVE